MRAPKSDYQYCMYMRSGRASETHLQSGDTRMNAPIPDHQYCTYGLGDSGVAYPQCCYQNGSSDVRLSVLVRGFGGQGIPYTQCWYLNYLIMNVMGGTLNIKG